jgi:hypothetical protein
MTLLKRVFADGHYSKVKICQRTLMVIKYSFSVLNAREIVCRVIFTFAKVGPHASKTKVSPHVSFSHHLFISLFSKPLCAPVPSARSNVLH